MCDKIIEDLNHEILSDSNSDLLSSQDQSGMAGVGEVEEPETVAKPCDAPKRKHFKRKQVPVNVDEEPVKQKIRSKSRRIVEEENQFEMTKPKTQSKAEPREVGRASAAANDVHSDKKSSRSIGIKRESPEMDMKLVFEMLLNCKQTIEGLKRRNAELTRENRTLRAKVG